MWDRLSAWQVRRAMSLLDVMIAVLVLSITLLAAAESLSSVQSYLGYAERRYDLDAEADRIFRAMSEDMALSGWHLPSFDDGEYLVSSWAEDRAKVYYPYVVLQASEGRPVVPVMEDRLGSPWANLMPVPSLLHVNRNASLHEMHFDKEGKRELFAALPGNTADCGQWLVDDERWRTSFYARSQELVFLKLSTSDWRQDPYEQQGQYIDFSGDDADWQRVDEIEGKPVAEWVQDEIEFRTSPAGGNKPASIARAEAEAEAYDSFSHEDLAILRMADVGFPPPANPGDPVIKDQWERPNAPAGKRFVDPIVISSSWLQFDGLDPVVRVRWETKYHADEVKLQQNNISNDERIVPTDLREYMYAVLPLSEHAGRLVRAYSVDLTRHPASRVGNQVGEIISQSGDFAFVIDEILSDNVMRIVCDTYRTVTDGSLEINEIRIRLFMATPRDANGSRSSHAAEHMFTMRAGSTDRRKARVLAAFGTSGVRPPY